MDILHMEKRQQQVNGGMSTGTGPSLWVFLIIVLGVLLALVLGTSTVMHLIQARQRRSLSRRIANGEVDLEQLGLKRLNVPQEQVNKMPQYIYTTESTGEITVPQPAASVSPTSPADHRHSTMYAQSTCSICLDDFVDKETKVRELPCKHIFHPECIDPFLMNNSSLCPLCKKSSLPAGFCPVTVTNVMVRRERLGRTMQRERQRGIQRLPTLHNAYVRSTAQRHRASQQNAAAAATTAADTTTPPTTEPTTSPNDIQNQDTELNTLQSPQQSTEVIPAEIAMQGREARRRWRRERLAQQHSADFDAHGEEARMAEARRPLWRRMMGIA